MSNLGPITKLSVGLQHAACHVSQVDAELFTLAELSKSSLVDSVPEMLT